MNLRCFCGSSISQFPTEKSNFAEQKKHVAMAVTYYNRDVCVQESSDNDIDQNVETLNNTLFDSIDDLSNFEGFPRSSKVTAEVRLFPRVQWKWWCCIAKQKKKWSPKRFEVSVNMEFWQCFSDRHNVRC